MSKKNTSFKILVSIILIFFIASTIMMFLPVFSGKSQPKVEVQTDTPQISVQAIDANGEEANIQVESIENKTETETNIKTTTGKQTTEVKTSVIESTDSK